MAAVSASEAAVDRTVEPYDTPAPLSGEIWKVTLTYDPASGLNRDHCFVTPHFQNNASATAGGLADALATAMSAYARTAIHGQVKVYTEDFNPGVPHNPLAVRNFGNVGTLMPNNGPAEIALCLSYYASVNAKRFRGRLYIPYAWISQSIATPPPAPAERPTAGQITACMNFYTTVIKAAATASGAQWVVASKVDKNAKVVSSCWCDDEWDIQRGRGLRGTTRQTLPVP